MSALFQLLRTRKKQDNEELNTRILKFGEPLYLHNNNIPLKYFFTEYFLQ